MNFPGSGIAEPLETLYNAGIAKELFPLILFIGIGAMIDFGPLLNNPKLMIFGAAAPFSFLSFCPDASESSSRAINMPLEISRLDKPSKHKLLEGRNSAGIKAKLFRKYRGELARQNRISHSKGGGYRFRKAVKVNNSPLPREREKRLKRLSREGEFRLKVVLDNYSVIGCPPYIFVPL